MVNINFSDLWTYKSGSKQRLPLSALKEPAGHVHGTLNIEVRGRKLPYMGYFGPDDVCFNDWAHELYMAMTTMAASPNSVHVFDEGEQGQPAFIFERSGALLYLSVADSAFEECGKADPAWQRVECEFETFENAIAFFLSDLRYSLREAAPLVATQWWARNVEGTA